MTHRNTRRATVATAAVGALALTALVAGPLTGRGAAAGSKCPTRIVSLSPTATEDLFAIGAGRQVVAVDNQSNYPASAPLKSGLSGYTPNPEGIYADYRPDLVVDSFNPNTVNQTLRTIHIRVLFQPTAADLRIAYQQILNLGTVTCHTAQATRLVHQMEAKVVAIRREVGAKARGLLYYDEISAPPYLYAASSRSFIGELFGTLGMRNVSNDPSGFPALSQEQVVKSSPKLIFLTDNQPKDGGITAHQVATRPGWSSIRAVKTHSIFPLNDDAASRWGPRITVLMQQIATDVLAYRAHH